MLKKGYTLAEVLITLGIIGVVAALTLPGLLADTTSAQIGPKLAKASATFAQANQALLHDLNLDSFVTKDGKLYYSSAEEYMNDLSNHMKIVPFKTLDYLPSVSVVGPLTEFNNDNCGLSNDGMLFCIVIDRYLSNNDPTLPKHRQNIGSVYVDIDAGKGANQAATDVFPFVLSADGSLKPAGATNWDNSGYYYQGTWREHCAAGELPLNPAACTGHIFENNLKVLYK